MFTGIIEGTGTIVERKETHGSIRLMIKHFYNDLVIGESVAVNGVCLTVADVSGGEFTADLLEETVLKTNLYNIGKHRSVNLERALCAGDRLGGHYVTGHVDEVNTIRSVTGRKNIIITVGMSNNFSSLIVQKGSIALNGISLTLVDTGKDWFSVHIIPHTYITTNLHELKVNDMLNIEYDILAKYVQKHLTVKESDINKQFLQKHGFL